MRLRIQLKYHHKLMIPFANFVIFRTWSGQTLMDELRMSRKGPMGIAEKPKGLTYDFGGQKGYRPVAEAATKAMLIVAAQKSQYFIPLYANYAFRMQSNIDLGKCRPPDTNECWHYPEGGDPMSGQP